MKNADMPAMPLFNGDGSPVHHSSAGMENHGVMAGLTKREMMAMNICSGNMAARTVQWADVNVELMARIAVQMTDVLLAELDRTSTTQHG